jgi:hypothetical protein
MLQLVNISEKQMQVAPLCLCVPVPLHLKEDVRELAALLFSFYRLVTKSESVSLNIY